MVSDTFFPQHIFFRRLKMLFYDEQTTKNSTQPNKFFANPSGGSKHPVSINNTPLPRGVRFRGVHNLYRPLSEREKRNIGRKNSRGEHLFQGDFICPLTQFARRTFFCFCFAPSPLSENGLKSLHREHTIVSPL